MDRCCDPEGDRPSHIRKPGTYSRLPFSALPLEIQQVGCLAVATTGLLHGGSLCGRNGTTRNRLEACPDYAVFVKHPVCLCRRIVPYGVAPPPNAFMDMGWLHSPQKIIRHRLILGCTLGSEIRSMFRVVQTRLAMVQKATRVGHVQKVDDSPATQPPECSFGATLDRRPARRHFFSSSTELWVLSILPL